MRNLLNDVRHVATPLSFSSREQLISWIKDASASLLSVSALDLNSGARPAKEIRNLRRYALWLEEAAVTDGLGEAESCLPAADL